MDKMQTDSELESDTSSVNDAFSNTSNNLPLSREQLEKRVESLMQENRVLKIEIETYKLRTKALQEENKELRKASVNIQVTISSYNNFFFHLFYAIFQK
jgi:coiled-coil domain-containing protein 6